MKNAIVLLITLAILAALSLLVSIGLGIVEKVQKEVSQKHTLIQTSQFYQDVVDILKKKSSEINSSDDLEMLFLMPIELKAGDLSIAISFDSVAKGLNPNNLFKKVGKKRVIDTNYLFLFDQILQLSEVQNKELFLALLEDSLDKDLEERIPGSEIALYNRRFAQGKIENFDKFQKIVDAYIRLTEDKSIYNIPWKKILSFDSEKIDLNYISPELLHFMLPYLDEQSILPLTQNRVDIYKDFNSLPLAKEYKEELKKYKISFYEPIVKVFVDIQEQKSSRIEFIYNIPKKEVTRVEYSIFR